MWEGEGEVVLTDERRSGVVAIRTPRGGTADGFAFEAGGRATGAWEKSRVDCFAAQAGELPLRTHCDRSEPACRCSFTVRHL
jgi:hypothetical protein